MSCPRHHLLYPLFNQTTDNAYFSTGRHGDIEDTLLRILMARAVGGKKFDKLMVSRVYVRVTRFPELVWGTEQPGHK